MKRVKLLDPEKYNVQQVEWFVFSMNYPEPALPDALHHTYSCLPYDEQDERYNFDDDSAYDVKHFKMSDCEEIY